MACFVGTEFDVLKGRGGDGEPVRKTPWGEIAWQLGGEKAFEAVRQHDEQGISPAGDVIRQMLPQGPVLILMDELLNYMSRFRKLGLADQLYNFLQNLAEEIRARNNAVLCVSIPSSTDIEMNPDDRRDYEALKQMLNRLGKAIIMSVDQEISEIIRRRLFDWHGMPEDGRKVASAYAEWAVEHAQELSGINADTAYEQFLAAYPFHPSVLSVFQRKWQSLPRFQRTRGVLRLLALWVAHAYQEEHRKAAREPLITLGLAPFENQNFRTALVRAAWLLRTGDPRHHGHRGPGRRPCRPAGQGGRRGDPQGPVAPQDRHDHLLRVQRRHVPVEGRGIAAGDPHRRQRAGTEHGRRGQRAGGPGQFLLLPELGAEPLSLRPGAEPQPDPGDPAGGRRGQADRGTDQEGDGDALPAGQQGDGPPVLAQAEQRRAQPRRADDGDPRPRTRQRRPGRRSR